MGKRGGARKASSVSFGSNNTISLREEATGKKLGKGGSSNAKHISKIEHLERLAVWTSSEASIPSLGTFFGRRLASVGESNGKFISPSVFQAYSGLRGPLGDRMFDLVTQQRKDHQLTFEDLVIAKGTYEKGAKHEIEEFIYQLLGVSGDGILGRSDLESVLAAMFDSITSSL